MAMMDGGSKKNPFKRTTAAQRHIRLSMSEYSRTQVDNHLIKGFSLTLMNRYGSSKRKRQLRE